MPAAPAHRSHVLKRAGLGAALGLALLPVSGCGQAATVKNEVDQAVSSATSEALGDLPEHVIEVAPLDQPATAGTFKAGTTYLLLAARQDVDKVHATECTFAAGTPAVQGRSRQDYNIPHQGRTYFSFASFTPTEDTEARATCGDAGGSLIALPEAEVEAAAAGQHN